MHELLLAAQVPPSQHSHILRILAGITAMQPLSHLTQHLIFAPTRDPSQLAAILNASKASKPGAPAGGAPSQQSTDLYYLQLVGDMSGSAETANEKHGIDQGNGTTAERNGEAGDASEKAKDNVFARGKWTLEFRDLPDVIGRRPATSRLMASVLILEGDPRAFVEGLGYAYKSSYLLIGQAFTHNNIRLTVTRTIPLSSSSDAATDHPSIPQLPPSSSLSSLPPLDSSGSYLLQASVRVQDGSKPEIMSKGFSELAALKEMLKGVVELEPGDRLGFDTRVR